uniref:WD_REPEATS_REGION domain-containing protein n=1 Tax=Steinernema glaseri TaxID=37863 RepID=A0A1I7ZDA8_9BILA
MHILAGNTKGELGQFDLRSNVTLLGKYRGFAGSIRCIDAHPTAPYAVSCGIDRFVILHDIETRKIVKKVYCKARLNQLVMKKALSLLDGAGATKGKAGAKSTVDSDGFPEIKEEPESEDEAIWENMKLVGDKTKPEVIVEEEEPEEEEVVEEPKPKKKKKVLRKRKRPVGVEA